MGDCQNGGLRVDFDRTLKLTFLGSQVSTDAGLLVYRELDDALHLTETGAVSVQDSRLGQNKQHGILPLLLQSIHSRLAGYEDVNDAERLCADPTVRPVVGGKASQTEKQAASTMHGVSSPKWNGIAGNCFRESGSSLRISTGARSA
jgi:hypothetical protein